MTDREAFEAAYAEACDKRYTIFQDFKAGWQAALASERAKQNAATNVGIDWANPATLNGVLCHAVQAEPVPFNAPGKAHVEAMLGNAAHPAVQSEPVTLDRWGIKSVPGRPEDYWFEKMPDGYWTPWHIAHEALQRAAPPAVQAKPARHEHERGAPLTADCDNWCRSKHDAFTRQSHQQAEPDPTLPR